MKPVTTKQRQKKTQNLRRQTQHGYTLQEDTDPGNTTDMQSFLVDFPATFHWCTAVYDSKLKTNSEIIANITIGIIISVNKLKIHWHFLLFFFSFTDQQNVTCQHSH